MVSLIMRFGFVLTLLAVFVSNQAFSATVEKVNKKRRYVIIDEADDTGFKKGARVCFKSKSGKKVACGKVRRTKNGKAYIKVNKKRISKVRKGYTAYLKTKGSATDSTASESTASKKPVFAVRFAYLPSFLTPTVYNKFTYVAPEGESAETLWDTGEVNNQSLQVLGLEFESPFIGVLLGARYTTYRDFLHEADYDPADKSIYFEGNVTGSAIGVYLDYTGLRFSIIPGSDFVIPVGLDYDMSTLEFKGVKKQDGTDSEEVLYTLKSTQSVISLRLGAKYELLLSAIQLSTGLQVLVPVSSGTPGTTAEINDPNASKLENPEQDLIDAVGHTQGSVGVQVLLGAGVAF